MNSEAFVINTDRTVTNGNGSEGATMLNDLNDYITYTHDNNDSVRGIDN